MANEQHMDKIGLETKAKWLRQQTLERIVKAGRGHIGGSLSCVEIMVALYYQVMKPEDRFIISKGQACDLLYIILADKGLISQELLETFNQPGSILEGHPNRRTPGIYATTGSLGHGLGIGCGAALAKKLKGGLGNIYILMGDGECEEGSVWEAAMFASYYNLNNLVAIVDRNHYSATDNTKMVGNLDDKFDSFGWSVFLGNGHNVGYMVSTLESKCDRPKAIIASTVKGKGVSFMENTWEWHNRVPKGIEVDKARKELA